MMGKEDLISEISEVTQLSEQDSETVLATFVNVVKDELKEGEKIQFMHLKGSSALNAEENEEEL